ncbi:MAG: hypothetical protein JXO48_06210 [Deltaproteobacteria bacterium]|nr:hypothetical protein [Deltaproteobacteria bacterium]
MMRRHRGEYLFTRQSALFSNQCGITLLDTIVTLVVAAILGMMLAQFGGKALTQSGDPAVMLKKDYNLALVMERITADYRDALNQGTLNSSFFTARDSAAKINALYGSNIDGVTLGNTAFQLDMDNTNYTESGSDSSVWKMTIVKGDQELITLFVQ